MCTSAYGPRPHAHMLSMFAHVHYSDARDLNTRTHISSSGLILHYTAQLILHTVPAYCVQRDLVALQFTSSPTLAFQTFS
jgi:uncharacterized UPF0160 family protein